MGLEFVRVTHDGPVSRLTLARPERRNALSLALMQEEQYAERVHNSADPQTLPWACTVCRSCHFSAGSRYAASQNSIG